jgi:hypothetical protein
VPKELRVSVEDRPGALADLAEALGRAGVNIEGLAGVGGAGPQGEIRVLVEDAAAARRALEGGRMRVSAERDVVTNELENRPGELGRTARRLADAGVNIESTYVIGGSGGRKTIAFAVADAEKARRALGASR